MSYAVVFLDIPYSLDFYIDKIISVSGLKPLVVSCRDDFNEMRKAIEFAFQTTNGLFIVYPKRLWHKLQKIMLVSFERPSVFKDEAYIIASDFEKLSEGVFAGFVYNKPIVFLKERLEESFNFESLKKFFPTKKNTIGIFEGNLNTQNTIFSDEVYSVVELNKQEIAELNFDKTKIFAYDTFSCHEALYSVIVDKPIKISIIDLSSGAFFASKLMSIESFKRHIALCIENLDDKTLEYFLGIDESYKKRFGYFSETFAKELSSFSLTLSNADFAISIINNHESNKFLFFVCYKDNSYNFSIREFSGNYIIVRQKVATFAMLFLREFILSKNL
jgi:nicotinamide mononucleotide (NMN) deamidase PncC